MENSTGIWSGCRIIGDQEYQQLSRAEQLILLKVSFMHVESRRGA